MCCPAVGLMHGTQAGLECLVACCYPYGHPIAAAYAEMANTACHWNCNCCVSCADHLLASLLLRTHGKCGTDWLAGLSVLQQLHRAGISMRVLGDSACVTSSGSFCSHEAAAARLALREICCCHSVSKCCAVAREVRQ